MHELDPFHSGTPSFSKTGKVMVKKATPRGTYKVKVTVKAAGTKNYTAKTVTRSLKIIVK